MAMSGQSAAFKSHGYSGDMNNIMEYPAGAGAMLPSALQESYAELRQLSIFHGIPDEVLISAIAAGGITLRGYERDVFVADPHSTGAAAAGQPSRAGASAAPIYFISDGQIGAAVFDGNEFAERRTQQEHYEQLSDEERKDLSRLRPPPLARIARKNLATFMAGDLFNSGALMGAGGDPVAFYTLGPSKVAVIQQGTIAELAVRFPFFEGRFRRAIQSSRARLRNITGVKQEILDFFIRQGISVSGPMVRVRQLDRCIDCKQCEQACEERYGSKRLTLGGYQLGMLDFVYTCRTCVDQRCIDPCEYDSIKYDPARGEVVINEASCTGCTLCAQSCPYHAIEMVDVEDPANPTYREDFKTRLDGQGALHFGAGTARMARPRRIANKCDHCVTYRDQACVSACPTGALVEISAYEVFHERHKSTAQNAKAGYAEEIRPDKNELLPTEPFTKGLGVGNAGLAKVRRGKMFPVVMWGLGLAVFFMAVAEIFLRMFWAKSSLQYFLLMQQPEMLPAMALEKVNFRAGNELALWCGYIGTGLMVISSLYPMARRINVFRFIASNTMWFDFHMMAGTVGPMFIVLHSAFKLDNWVSAAFWSMVIVVVSGIIGRYIYTQVPDLLNGRELEELEHERALARLRETHPATAAAADAMLRGHRQEAEHIARSAGLVRTLVWLIMEDLRRPSRWFSRLGMLKRSGAPSHVVREFRGRIGRMMLADRRRVLVPRAQLLLHSWKKVHVPFTIIMVIISAVHIWVAFEHSM